MAKFIGKYYVAIGFILIVAALLSSCYTDKKATKQVTKAIQNKPLIAAKLTRDAYPCITVKSDTAVIYKDSIVMVDCPPNANEYFIVHDTITKKPDTVFIAGKKVPVKIQLPQIRIVEKIEDSAKINIARAEVDAALLQVRKTEDKLLIANNTIAKHEKNEASLWWTVKNFFSFRWIWLLCVLVGLYIFRKPILMLL